MWLSDRNTAIPEANNALVLGPNLAKVFFANLPVDWSALDELRQRDVMQEMDQPIKWYELKTAVKSWHKVESRDQTRYHQMPSNRSMMTTYFTFLTSPTTTGWRKLIFMSGTKSKLCQYQKVETYPIPKKWRGVTLVDIWAKIFNSILCGRAFKIMKAHGVKYQFFSPLEVGCPDGTYITTTTYPSGLILQS